MTAPKKSGRTSDTPPKVAFTLEQIEEEVASDVEPLRMGVRGKVLELRSPMDMEVADFEQVVSAMSADQDSLVGELGEAGAMLKLLPAMIGETNYRILVDAKVTLPVLMQVFTRVQSYYADAMEQMGTDPKDSTSE